MSGRDHEQPSPRPMDLRAFARIPAALVDCPQWVCWKLVRRKEGEKPTKVPFDAKTGFPASTRKPATWCTYEQALAAYADGGYDGIGFVFTRDDPFVGLDLDDCIDADGAVQPWARELLATMRTYAEISPSGSGIKVFARGALPEEGRRKNGFGPDGKGKVELYGSGRFFTVTGRLLDGSPATVEDCLEPLRDVYRLIAARSKPAATRGRHANDVSVPPLADQLVIDRLLQNPKTAALWAGANGTFGSGSEADLSLVNSIAYFAGADPDRIDRIFRQSGRCREKWDRKDYRDRTIDKALEGRGPGDFFEWRRPARDRHTNAADVSAQGSDIPAPEAEQDECSTTTPTKKLYMYTEYGNAQRLVARFGDRFRYCPQLGKFLVYDGKRWCPDELGQMPRFAKRIARDLWRDVANAEELGLEKKSLITHAVKSESAQGIAAMLKLAQSEPGVPVHVKQLDAHAWLLNTESGTLDLRTGRLLPHTRGHLLTKLAPVRYDPAATCPRWDAFLDRIMGGNQELIAYLRRVFGVCLTGDISVQELFVFHGGGANGKNVLMDTLAGIMGEYAGAAPPGLLTTRTHEEHPTEIADLQGKRLVFASETEENARLRIQLVKRITGDPTLKGRFMRQDYFEFARTHKTVLITNNKPVIREASHAVWRRIRLVPFGVTIPESERDPKLTEKLRSEWPGILRWGVMGGLDWQSNGMGPPSEVLAATASYQDEQNPLKEYLSDRCILAAPARVTRGDLYGDYVSYCQTTREPFQLSNTEFYARVRALDGVEEHQWRPVGSTVPARGFRGIGLAFTGGSIGGEAREAV